MNNIMEFAHRTEILARLKRTFLIFWLPLVLAAVIPAIAGAIAARFPELVPGSPPTISHGFLAVISFVTGIFLGVRYKIFILLPVVPLAMILAFVVGIAQSEGLWSIVLTMAIVSSAVHLGYMIGIMIHAIAAEIGYQLPARAGWRLHSDKWF